MTTQTVEGVSGFGQILQENKNELARIENFKNSRVSVTPRNLVFAGTAIGGFALVGLIGAQIITGVVALGTAVVGGAVLYYGVRVMKRMDPVIKQKLKNQQIKMMVSEARKNAIYQLDNQVLENHRRLEAARTARDQVGAQIRNLEAKINPENKGKPQYERKLEIIATIKEAYENIKVNIDRGAKANAEFERKVQDYKDMEAFAVAAGEIHEALNTAGDDKLAEMLSLESFNQIETDFNTALVSIENSARDMAVDAEV